MEYKELTLLLSTELVKDDVSYELYMNTIRMKIKELGGDIIKEEREGKKRLAYSIQGQEYAEYVYIEVKTENKDMPASLSSWLNIKDVVLRYLLVDATERHAKELQDEQAQDEHYKIYVEYTTRKRYKTKPSGDTDWNELYEEDDADEPSFYIVEQDGEYADEFYTYGEAIDFVKKCKEEDKRTKEIAEDIRVWVSKNFGDSEAEEPSWNIDALAKYLSNKIK